MHIGFRRQIDKLEFSGDAPAGNALRTLVHPRTSFGPLDHKLLRKLEFGGESPLTMRHGHWRSSNILWAPRPELRRLYRIDHHRKNEPGVPKGWEDYHTGEGSHCPRGHPRQIPICRFADLCRYAHYIILIPGRI